MTRRRRRRGRPAGAKSVAAVQTVHASRCPQCSSTRRTRYRALPLQEYAGLLADGTPFTAIVRRRCACLDCGLPRIDRSYEYAPASAPAGGAGEG